MHVPGPNCPSTKLNRHLLDIENSNMVEYKTAMYLCWEKKYLTLCWGMNWDWGNMVQSSFPGAWDCSKAAVNYPLYTGSLFGLACFWLLHTVYIYLVFDLYIGHICFVSHAPTKTRTIFTTCFINVPWSVDHF